jgi:hypothetical protein
MAYKGKPSAKTIALEFPFVVETMVPEGGLGRRLDDMHRFHRQRGITDHHTPRRETMSTTTFDGASRTLPPLKHLPRNFPAG